MRGERHDGILSPARTTLIVAGGAGRKSMWIPTSGAQTLSVLFRLSCRFDDGAGYPTGGVRAREGRFPRKSRPRIVPRGTIRGHLPATARICEAAMGPGRGIFLTRRECARGGEGRRANRGLNGVVKGVSKRWKTAVYLQDKAVNLSDFVEIRKSASAVLAERAPMVS